MMSTVFNTYGTCGVIAFHGTFGVKCDPGTDAGKRTVSNLQAGLPFVAQGKQVQLGPELTFHFTMRVNPCDRRRWYHLLNMLMKQLALVTVAVGLAWLPVRAQNTAPAGAAPAAETAVRPGEAAGNVRCLTNPNQSYALYLPSNYTAERLWPILYVFDPGGRGSNPVNLMKDAAEHYGYIVAASNNARNGPLKPQSDAAQAVWLDTHMRLAIDDKRMSFAGHSGGARLAAWVAQSCKCALGLVLNGAGYPLAFPPTRDSAISVFAVVGMMDFNYGEMVQLDAKLESLRYPHFLRRFDGPHAWAPAEVWEEALAWLELSAMKQGRRPADTAFVAVELARAIERARKLEDAGAAYFAWESYRQSAAAFTGLIPAEAPGSPVKGALPAPRSAVEIDTAALAERVATLGKIPAVRKGQSDEKKEIEERQAIMADILRLASGRGEGASELDAGDFSDALASPAGGGSDGDAVKAQALRKIRQLREALAKERQPERLRALQRTQTGIALFVLDAGNALMAAKEYPAARTQFELAVAAQPERARANVALARCLLVMGDRGEALRALERARAAGVTAAELRDASRNVPEFEALASDARFQELLANSPLGNSSAK